MRKFQKTVAAILAGACMAGTMSLAIAPSVFAAEEYKITAGAGAHGSITHAGTTNVAQNGSLTYQITPDAGYEINEVLVDGVSQGALDSYTFENVSSRHTLAVSFRQEGSPAYTSRTLRTDTCNYFLSPGDIYDIRIHVEGQGVSQEDITVTSSRDHIAKVEQVPGTEKYRITGLQEGTTYIEAVAKGTRASIRVDVQSGVDQYGESCRSVSIIDYSEEEMERYYGSVGDFRLNQRAVDLSIGGSQTLKAFAGEAVSWESSDPSVAFVDDTGMVTGLAMGTAEITATSQEGETASAQISVNQSQSSVTSGVYRLRLKDTDLYLEAAGQRPANGANVQVGQGSSEAQQQFRLQGQPSAYTFSSMVETGWVLDVNRALGEDPTGIDTGDNLNLWTAGTDADAQEWTLTQTGDGYYLLCLRAYPDLVVTAEGMSDGSNVFLDTYTGQNPLQRWELVSASDNPADSGGDASSGLAAWVANTDGTALRVRTGPGTTYASIGSLAPGKQITVTGEADAGWYPVEGTGISGSVLRGWVSGEYLVWEEPETNPGSGDFGQNSPPDLYSAGYNQLENVFAQIGLYGQCTWYAWGRAYEVKGIQLPTTRGNAKTWLDSAKAAGYETGWEPRSNSIAVWDSSSAGHVAYVEQVSGDQVILSEANWNNSTSENLYSIEEGIAHYDGAKTLTVAEMQSRGRFTLLGYIYLE